jgi:hypothetical protein
MNRGWYRENWRHSLAAKGIKTRLYATPRHDWFLGANRIRMESKNWRTRDLWMVQGHEKEDVDAKVKKEMEAMKKIGEDVEKMQDEDKKSMAAKQPLITNEEINIIQQMSGKSIGEMTEQELQSFVREIRGQPKVAMDAKAIIEKAKGFKEPFLNDNERTDEGNMLRRRHMAQKKEEVVMRMNEEGIGVNKQADMFESSSMRMLMDDFMKGRIPEDDFDRRMDSYTTHSSWGFLARQEKRKNEAKAVGDHKTAEKHTSILSGDIKPLGAWDFGQENKDVQW